MKICNKCNNSTKNDTAVFCKKCGSKLGFNGPSRTTTNTAIHPLRHSRAGIVSFIIACIALIYGIVTISATFNSFLGPAFFGCFYIGCFLLNCGLIASGIGFIQSNRKKVFAQWGCFGNLLLVPFLLIVYLMLFANLQPFIKTPATPPIPIASMTLTTTPPTSTTTTINTTTINITPITTTGGGKVLGDTAGALPVGHAGYFAIPMCYACHMPGSGVDQYPMAPVWAGSIANPGPWTVVEGSPGDHTGRTSDAQCITCHK